MSKQEIKKINGVVSAYFAHTGHITKAEAQELSGLDESHFAEVYAKAAKIFDKIEGDPSAKVNRFLDHLAAEVDEYMKKISGVGIA
ncbi:hypothetical protein [Desulfolutivibrio sulfoxidireducens]|uniref:hypothetical protein n=1 Tax=Desulfolutivibrio sulfoxidireducens TaxID=2773299 RepID=UPI00159E742B|nr:hypothetical protein [Desulfolutivibrio sulfoxidireducens]QLA15941.1 hypothetical protein GD605_07170 [Desulfolutivibrio sulfoxidireducens]QLA20159.1 hypothetical protein GD604_10740 [Desulfolutivibrio sulfoxidireducens]